MIVNPYAERGMIRDRTAFFGRTRELSEILSRLFSMQSVSVVGERRIGKSSFLYHLTQTGSDQLGNDFLLRYLDLQSVLSSEEFYERACELLGAEGSTHRDLERAISGKKVGLCLDEFEQATGNPEFGADFFNVLRSFAGTGKLALVVATQHTLSDLYRAEAIPTSPFPNIFTLLRLGPLAEDEARDLVTRPAERAGQPFTEAEASFVLGLAGAHPYRLNVACTLLYEAKLSGRVDFTDVRLRFEEEVRNGQTAHAMRAEQSPESKWSGTVWTIILALGSMLMAWVTAQSGNPIGLLFAVGLGLMALWLFVVDTVPTLRLRRGLR